MAKLQNWDDPGLGTSEPESVTPECTTTSIPNIRSPLWKEASQSSDVQTLNKGAKLKLKWGMGHIPVTQHSMGRGRSIRNSRLVLVTSNFKASLAYIRPYFFLE